MERRARPRIYEAFPANVRGVDESGCDFELDTVLDNLSTGGLYLRLPRSIRRGSKLSLLVQFSSIHNGATPTPTISLKGTVTRAEPQPDGRCGLAVVVNASRLMSSESAASGARVIGARGGAG